MLFVWHGERTDIFIKLVPNCMWWLTKRHTQSGCCIYFKYMKNQLKSLCFLHLKIVFSLRNMLGTASHIIKSSDCNNFIIQSTNALSFITYSLLSDSLWLCGLQPTRLLCRLDSPGKNTGVDCHALFQGSYHPRDWTQDSQLQADSLPSEPPGKPIVQLAFSKIKYYILRCSQWVCICKCYFFFMLGAYG